MSWIQRKMSFSMMKSVFMCICGSRPIKHEQEKQNVEESASDSEARCFEQYNTKDMLNIAPLLGHSAFSQVLRICE